MSETWLQVITIVGGNLIVMLTFFGVSVSLHNGMRGDVRAIQQEIRAIQQEMKDFHGRMERQDAEFKGKMALQDAEFKAHIMHYHEPKNKGI